MGKWNAIYRGHEIRVESGLLSRELFVDGKLKATSGFGLRTELRGMIEDGESAGDIVVARLHGVILMQCDLQVEEVESRERKLSNIIRGVGTSSGEAWKGLLESLRKRFPNLGSYDDRELSEIVKTNDLKITQTFGASPRVETNLEIKTPLGETYLDVLSRIPQKRPGKSGSSS